MSVKPTTDGRWKAEVNIKGYPRRRRTFDDKVDALRFEQDLISQYRKDSHSDQRGLLTLIELWYELHGTTLRNHETRLQLLKDTCAGLGYPVAATVTPRAVLRFRAKRLRVVSGKTWNNQLSLLKSVYNRLHLLHEIDYPSPIATVQPLALQERQLNYLTLPEIDQLLNEIRERGVNSSTSFVARLCLQTGARWGEAENLLVKQLHNNSVTYENTKGRRVRTIPLHADFYAELMVLVDGKGKEARVFQNCQKAFAHALKRADIQLPKGQATHICRHTFASHFVMNGGHLLTLQKILGHTEIKQTMRYAHLSEDYLTDAVRLNPLVHYS